MDVVCKVNGKRQRYSEFSKEKDRDKFIDEADNGKMLSGY
jgi:hypothetical protein